MNADTPQTSFFWPARRKSSWRLAGLIFLMLFAHSAAFFLFQAATPTVNPPPRTAPPVQLLTPYAQDGHRSAENESLLRWIEAEDPALIARVPNVAMPDPIEVPYRASFIAKRTPPLRVPPEPPTVQFPPARDALSLIQSGMPARQISHEPLPPRPTEVSFSTKLAGRLETPPVFKPKGRTAQLVQVSHFLLGVTAEGETRFVFPQKPESGSVPALEAEAAAFLAGLHFKPDPSTPILWESANIQWGDDIVSAP
jgi:hypothetical protein